MDRPPYPILLGLGKVSQARFAVPVKENMAVDRYLSVRPRMTVREIGLRLKTSRPFQGLQRRQSTRLCKG